MADKVPEDPLGILLPNAGQLAATPWAVTAQYIFNINARTEQGAILAVARAISIGAIIAPYLIGHATQAEPLTKQALEAMGIKLP